MERKFKKGDRVECVEFEYQGLWLCGKTGTIVWIDSEGLVSVEFDEKVGGVHFVEGKDGHGVNLPPKYLIREGEVLKVKDWMRRKKNLDSSNYLRIKIAAIIERNKVLNERKFWIERMVDLLERAEKHASK